MTERPNKSGAPDGAFAWIQRDQENAVRVPAFRENGRWVLGYYANGDVEVWADADIAKVELIPTVPPGAPA